MKKTIMTEDQLSSCFFRTSVEPPHRKALIQITEKCNLHCSHCFVSAEIYGKTMSFESIKTKVIPRLKSCRVVSVTLTGGEPFIHKNIIDIIRLLRENDLSVSICTNATCITKSHFEQLEKFDNVHINVSLDGFSETSHSVFREKYSSFEKTIETIKALSEKNLLQGLLVTPNNLAEVSEYKELCNFAVNNGTTYVLMNPLSPMGRGADSIKELAASAEFMTEVKKETKSFGNKIDMVYIRFPNEEKLPLNSCEAGNIIYIFTPGEVTVCPYLVFATNNPESLYSPDQFIVGNIFEQEDIAERLDAYKLSKKYNLGSNNTCISCLLEPKCGKGCPAAIIASGKKIEEVDEEVCPIFNN